MEQDLHVARSQVEKEQQRFEEVTLLDLKMKYGQTDAGRLVSTGLFPNKMV